MQVKPRGGRWTGRFQWTHLICLLRALPFQVLELVQSIRVQQVAQAFPFGVELISAHPLPVTFPRWASPSFRRANFTLWPQNKSLPNFRCKLSVNRRMVDTFVSETSVYFLVHILFLSSYHLGGDTGTMWDSDLEMDIGRESLGL